MTPSKQRAYLAEFIGSLLLTGVVVGSGILGLQISGGDAGIALIGNSLATGAILWVLVATLAPISGAHFNPAVTLAFLLRRDITPGPAFIYVLLQIATNDRSGLSKILAEGLATFTLVFAIFGAIRHAPKAVPVAVALAILAGYWWTSSTSFANPAITIARSLSDSFAGIHPGNIPGFVIGQIIGAISATAISAILFSDN